MKEVICEGSITLSFANTNEIEELLSDLDLSFNTDVRDIGNTHAFNVYAALYAASQGTCVLMDTYKVENRKYIVLRCGTYGVFDLTKINHILKLIEPYTVSGEIQYAGINMSSHHYFSKKCGWEYQKADIMYQSSQPNSEVA